MEKLTPAQIRAYQDGKRKEFLAAPIWMLASQAIDVRDEFRKFATQYDMPDAERDEIMRRLQIIVNDAQDLAGKVGTIPADGYWREKETEQE